MVTESDIPLLDRWQEAWLGHTIRASRWMFPAIESAHLLGLAVLLGSVLIVNLGFFGLGMRRTRAYRVAEQLEPVTLAALCVNLVSGSLLFAGDPVKFSADRILPFKLAALGMAILFQCTIHHRAMRSPEVGVGRIGPRIVAAIALALWIAVAVLGRGIGVFN